LQNTGEMRSAVTITGSTFTNNGMINGNLVLNGGTLKGTGRVTGAANVVATLWRIDDTGASVFAGRFYEAALRLPPPEALAEAQRQMIADSRYSNPYYWAAYDVSGTGSWGRSRAIPPPTSE